MNLRKQLLPWALSVAVIMSGCVTTPKTTPPLSSNVPPQIEAKEAPTPTTAVQPKSVTDLLRAAQEEFEAANQAQEKGDKEAALKHYSNMFDKLKEANLDPGVFYSLRNELSRLLSKSKKHAGGEKESTPEEPIQVSKGDLVIDFPLDERVLAEIDEIQNLYPKNFQGGLDRSARYLSYIQAEFAKAGLPKDLVWLAQVESQFSPKVVSRAGAGGMWQFMRSTGSRFNLRMDSYVDERYNWQKSTQAAIAYLKQLGERFDGSWPLAVTAYNMGEGGVERAVASTGEKDLWRLLETPPASQMMQQETKKFYPKLLATIMVAKSPDRFGFSAPPETPEQITRVSVNGSYSLAALERACGFEDGTLRQLNQDLIRGVTPPKGPFELAVPVGAEDKLSTVLNDLPQVRVEKPKKQTYTVKRGDSLTVIASKYGVSIEDLARANRLRTDQALTSGRRLSIPVGDDIIVDMPVEKEQVSQKEAVADEKSSTEKAGKDSVPASNNKGVVYTVKKGECLSGIAEKNKVKVEDIAKWNNLTKNATVRPGDQLRLAPLEEMIEKANESSTHVVQAGETPAKIAKLYSVKLEDLLEWNQLSMSSIIAPGDKLSIRSEVGEPSAEVAKADVSVEESKGSKVKASEEPKGLKSITHTVVKGEAPASIADKYKVDLKDLLAWNKMTEKSVVLVGQKLTINVPDTAPASRKTVVAKLEPKTEVKSAEKAKAVSTGEAKAEPVKTAVSKSSKPVVESPKETAHVVSKGETASSIAQKYGVKVSDVLTWNNVKNAANIQVGQKIVIKK